MFQGWQRSCHFWPQISDSQVGCRCHCHQDGLRCGKIGHSFHRRDASVEIGDFFHQIRLSYRLHHSNLRSSFVSTRCHVWGAFAHIVAWCSVWRLWRMLNPDVPHPNTAASSSNGSKRHGRGRKRSRSSSSNAAFMVFSWVWMLQPFIHTIWGLCDYHSHVVIFSNIASILPWCFFTLRLLGLCLDSSIQSRIMPPRHG